MVNHMSTGLRVWLLGMNFLFWVSMSGLAMMMIGNIHLNIKLGNRERNGEVRERE